MQWFYNLTLKGKLMTGFVLVSLIAAVLGGVGLYNIRKIDQADTRLYERMTVPLGDMADIAIDFQRMRVNVRDLIAATGMEEKKRIVDRIRELSEAIDASSNKYEKTLFTEEGRKAFEEFKKAKADFRPQLDKVIALGMAGKEVEATAALQGEVGKISRVEQEIIQKLMDLKVKNAKLTADQNAADAQHSTVTMLALLGIGVLIAVGLGIFISGVVLKQLGADPKEVEEVASLVAAGDLQRQITLAAGDTGSVMAAMKKMVETIQLLVSDVGMLSDAAIAGKLATRADAAKHRGDFQKIVAGINDTLDAVIGPLNVAAEYVDRISKGDIPPRITDNYNGDFNEIKLNLNACIDTMNGLLSETDRLVNATVAGQLATRCDVSKFAGGWGTLVSGVNNLCDAFVGPINVTAEYVDRISKGEIPSKITDSYNGDFNEIKNNLNVLLEVLTSRGNDVATLINSAIQGKLDYRADSSKYVGVHKDAIEGVNRLLDAIIGPLNVAAEYIDRISKGDIPPKITDTYQGDFNEIKLNLNACIETMGDLLTQTDILIKGAADGELDKRANAELFMGGWKQLVTGINATMTNIVNPLHVTADYVDRISRGDMPPLIVSEYKGQYNQIKNNLNALISATNGITENAKKVSQGNLMVELKKRSDNDELMASLAVMVDKLKDVVEQVQSAADSVASGGQQMSSTAQQMSQGATEQAASAEEVSSSMEQMASSIRQNTDNALQTEKIAIKSASDAKEGGKAVNETVSAMKEIATKISIIEEIAPSDQPAGAERGHRGGPRRRARQGVCRGGLRGQETCRAEPVRRRRDQ